MESHSTSLVFPPTTSFRFLFRSDNEDAALLLSWKDFRLWCGPTHGRSRPHPPHCSVLPAASLGRLPVPGVDAGFYKRMRSSQENANRAEPTRVPFLPPLAGRWGKTARPPLGKRGWGSNKHLLQRGPTSTRPAPSSSVKPTSFSPVLTQCARR